MTTKFCFALSALAAVSALTLGTNAHAQSQGSWLVRGGIMQLAPQVTSGTLSAPSLPGVQTSVSTSTSSVMFQLEFVGFTRLGVNPLKSLKDNIPAYQNLRESGRSLPSRFNNYD